MSDQVACFTGYPSGLFQELPRLVENTDLTPKQLILSGKVKIFFRNAVRVPMCCDPFVQRRHAKTRIIDHLLARQPTGQCNPHRILTKFICPFQSRNQPSLFQ